MFICFQNSSLTLLYREQSEYHSMYWKALRSVFHLFFVSLSTFCLVPCFLHFYYFFVSFGDFFPQFVCLFCIKWCPELKLCWCQVEQNNYRIIVAVHGLSISNPTMVWLRFFLFLFLILYWSSVPPDPFVHYCYLSHHILYCISVYG